MSTSLTTIDVLISAAKTRLDKARAGFATRPTGALVLENETAERELDDLLDQRLDLMRVATGSLVAA